jgi:hypothetical protein
VGAHADGGREGPDRSMSLDMLLVPVGSGWMRHGYQGGRRDLVGMVKGRSSDRPLRGRRRGHTGVVSTRLPLQTRPFGAFATTGSFYSLRLPLRARRGRSDTVAVLLQAQPRGGSQDGYWGIAHYAAHDQYAW